MLEKAPFGSLLTTSHSMICLAKTCIDLRINLPVIHQLVSQSSVYHTIMYKHLLSLLTNKILEKSLAGALAIRKKQSKGQLSINCKTRKYSRVNLTIK